MNHKCVCIINFLVVAQNLSKFGSTIWTNWSTQKSLFLPFGNWFSVKKMCRWTKKLYNPHALQNSKILLISDQLPTSVSTFL